MISKRNLLNIICTESVEKYSEPPKVRGKCSKCEHWPTAYAGACQGCHDYSQYKKKEQ